MNVLVYLEHWDGKFKKSSYELVSYAVALAKQMQSKAYGVVLGNAETTEVDKLAEYGLENIAIIDHKAFQLLDNQLFTDVLAQITDKLQANFIIFAHNNTGKAIASRLSARLKAGLVSGIVALPDSTSPFIVRKKLFTGKATAQVKVNTDKVILTLSQNAFGVFENKASLNKTAIDIQVNEGLAKTQLLDTQKFTAKVLLTDAEIVVSGGRGLKGPENWNVIEELADAMGAATACTRPVSDEGWRPHHEHVGQTGKIVAPMLYFACGISGAIQHVAGISSSKYIIAINKDAEAPIFEAADYGIVGDVMQVLPEITKKVKEVKK
ncbi:MAG: electron transfer flavoprotein subunit alpha/FixB family protein [Bacteroidales bacterium]|jgi:electron transfer flavoprotein alpha subunit|nr:electron transfer flavoprotein subunit alpha/FixB family protein [Bacteroidales bacterium]